MSRPEKVIRKGGMDGKEDIKISILHIPRRGSREAVEWTEWLRPRCRHLVVFLRKYDVGAVCRGEGFSGEPHGGTTRIVIGKAGEHNIPEVKVKRREPSGMERGAARTGHGWQGR